MTGKMESMPGLQTQEEPHQGLSPTDQQWDSWWVEVTGCADLRSEQSCQVMPDIHLICKSSEKLMILYYRLIVQYFIIWVLFNLVAAVLCPLLWTLQMIISKGDWCYKVLQAQLRLSSWTMWPQLTGSSSIPGKSGVTFSESKDTGELGQLEGCTGWYGLPPMLITRCRDGHLRTDSMLILFGHLHLQGSGRLFQAAFASSVWCKSGLTPPRSYPTTVLQATAPAWMLPLGVVALMTKPQDGSLVT